MSCCGVRVSSPSLGTSAIARRHRYEIRFEYTGQSALTVHGPVSGRRYHFFQPGAQMVIDARDRPHLARIATLREVG